MSDFWKIITILSIVITFAGTFVIAYSDAFVKPDLKLKIQFSDQSSLTKAKITIANNGLEPATNLRITLNPGFPIINGTVVFYTEEIFLNPGGGSQSSIATMPRLANDQKVVLETFLNSTELDTNYAVYVTHDKGSSELFYAKKQTSSFNYDILFSTISAIVASALAALFAYAGKTIYNQFYINKEQYADNGGMNLQDVINSQVIIQTQSSTPMSIDSPPTRIDWSAMAPNPQTSFQQPTTTDVRLLLAKIGREKISALLHEAKIIANDYHDDKMKKWINDELNGYVPNANSLPFKEKAKLSKLMPKYRHINTKFLLQFSDGTVSKENYPLVLGQDVKSIESWLERLKPGNNILTMPYTFPSHLEQLGGKSGNIEIPQFSLESIISGIEVQLSKYLQSKL